jgi:hypothetical protein
MDVTYSSHPSRREGSLASSRIAVGPLEREHVLDRLIQLRAILPATAQELAGARRQAAALRMQNRRLAAEVRRMQRRNAMRVSPTEQRFNLPILGGGACIL